MLNCHATPEVTIDHQGNVWHFLICKINQKISWSENERERGQVGAQTSGTTVERERILAGAQTSGSAY